jgi:hypothetical protein
MEMAIRQDFIEIFFFIININILIYCMLYHFINLFICSKNTKIRYSSNHSSYSSDKCFRQSAETSAHRTRRADRNSRFDYIYIKFILKAANFIELFKK